ncbi:MAG: permease-like cell division protein FtsX [Chloroflexota bacterium]
MSDRARTARLVRLSTAAAWNGLKRNRLATIAATVTMTLMLLVLASVLVIRAGLDAALTYADSKIEVVAYLKTSVDAEKAAQVEAQIADIPGVRDTTYISADEALAAFRQRLAERGEPDLTGNLGFNPLPASIEVALDSPLDTARVADSLTTIDAASSISRVIDGRAVAESLTAITSGLRIAGLIVLLGFTGAVLAVVVNALRLAALARSDEIEIMRLVGASVTWIRLPFIIEGVAIGLVGALITLFVFGILSAGIGALMLNLFRVLPLETSAILAGQVAISVLLAGIGLGALGALLSLRGRLG